MMRALAIAGWTAALPFWIILGWWASDLAPARGPDITVTARAAYAPGEDFIPTYRMLFLRACTSTSSRGFTSDAAPGRLWSVPAGGRLAADTPSLGEWHEVTLGGVEVPADMPPGPATFSGAAAFACNPLRRLFPTIVHYPPVRFIVLSPTAR